MDIIFNKKFLEHKTKLIPENPDRIIQFTKTQNEVDVINGSQFLELVHTNKYIQTIKNLSLGIAKNNDPDIEITPQSFDVACFAVGAAIMASEEKNFAIVRPPGHHASSNKAMGFCLFNNIAIATQKLVNKGKKVCIIDIDGHHGNGTQEIFYENNRVLYMSIHQSPAYPGTGQVYEVGKGEGLGYTVNIPLPLNSGDDIFLIAFDKLIPRIKEFSPDIIGISAGFDGYFEDPLLDLCLTSHSYYEFGESIRKNFKNYFAVLEGGYHDHLGTCIKAFLEGINGNKKIITEEKTSSEQNCHNLFKNTLKELNKYLQPMD